jgi:hypothetical protein
MVVPVVTVRLKLKPSNRPTADVSATDLPESVSNRIFSVKLHVGGTNLDLFAGASMTVRPLLVHAGKPVGAAGMAADAELDRTTGCVTLALGKPATIAFLLSDDKAPSLRVVVQDPVTDAELYRSPQDIPVELSS